MSYIGTEPKDIRSFGRTKFDYTASQGQTAFTGADDDGKVLAFTVGQIEVYVNGILMDDSDFTTTGTGTVTLASAANLNDVVNVVSFETNIPDSDYVPAGTGGTFAGNVSMSGTLGVTGAVTASNGLTVDDAGATPLTVDRATNDGTIIDVQKDGTSVGSIRSLSGDITIDGPSEHTGLRFEAADITPRHNGAASNNYTSLGTASSRYKDLFLGGGLYIGGTGSSNYLDDYEEGTWTPTVGAVTGQTQPTVTAGTFTGTYVKIGKIVHAVFYVGPFQFNSTGSGSALAVKGFPFNHSGADSPNGGVTSTYYLSWARPNYVALRPYTTNDFGFLSNNNTGNWGWETCSAAGTGSSRYLSGSITYYTNS